MKKLRLSLVKGCVYLTFFTQCAGYYEAKADVPVISGPITNFVFERVYYLLSSSSWTDAEAQAVAMGGHLVTVNSAAEDNWVYTNFSGFGGSNTYLWIGLTDQTQEGTFTWTSGEPVTYTHWYSGEPNDAGGNEDYTFIDTPDSFRHETWNDANNTYPDAAHLPRGVVEIITDLPPQPPAIVSQPADQTVVVGSVATFTVVATGTSPLRYQWFFNGTDISGATNASYTISSVQTNDAGAYSVVVSNSVDSVISSSATLSIADSIFFDDFEPDIDQSQWSAFGGTVRATNYGGSVSGSNSLWFGGSGSRFATTRSINVTAGGAIEFYLRIAGATLSSNWEKADTGEGVRLEYSTNNGASWTTVAQYNTPGYSSWTFISVSIPVGAQKESTKLRWRQLANSGASSDHWALDDVNVTGAQPPQIINLPTNRTVTAGSTVTFSVGATGTAPLHYQWQFNGTNISGAISSSLTLNNVQIADAGNYSVEVTNIAGAATSSNAVLTVDPAPPPAEVIAGPITNEVNGHVYYLLNSSTWTEAEAKAVTLSGHLVTINDAAEDNWVYTNFNTFGGSPSHQLWIGLTDQAQEGTFVWANGESLSYTHWYSGEPNDAGGGEDWTYITYPDSPATDRHSTWNDDDNSPTDDFGHLPRGVVEVGAALPPQSPSIVTQPADQTVTAGETASFSVGATGTAPLYYQWQFNGTNISNATSSTLTINNVQAANAGNYSVEVTNVAGAITSSNAVLTVNPAPPPAEVIAGPLTNSVNGHAYYLLSSSTWTEAEAKAVTLGGHLVTINDAAEDNWVYTNFSTFGGSPSYQLWIGLTDQAQEGTFVWISGESVTYTHWYYGEPNNAGGGENWTYITYPGSPATDRHGTWNDDDNSPTDDFGHLPRGVVEIGAALPPQAPTIVSHPADQTVIVGATASFTVVVMGTSPLMYQWLFNGTDIGNATNASHVIQSVQTNDAGAYSVVVSNSLGSVTSSNAVLTVNPAPPPAEVVVGPVTNRVNGHVYYLLSSSTWTEAEAKAVLLGGHLVTINDAAEDNWVYTNFSGFGGVNTYLWIGFSDESQEGTFQWANGEAVTYTHWYYGEPNNSGNEDYAYIDTPDSFRHETWNDAINAPLDNFGRLPRGVVEIGATSAPPATIDCSGILAGPIVNSANGHIYYLLNSNSWTASEACAVSMGGHLVTIDDQSEQDWVYNTFSTIGGVERGLWTGLNDVAQEGTFVWASGEPVTYLGWGPGEPNNSPPGGENYVHVVSPADCCKPGKWNDIDNTGTGFVDGGVVEIVPPVPADVSVVAGPVTNAANGNTYYLLSSSSWTDADAKAVLLGGHLVTINDAAEDNWVYTNFSGFGGSNTFLWIGLTDHAQEGTFVWTSGEPISYTHWYYGEPNNSGNEDYAYMDTPDSPRHETWNDANNTYVDGAGRLPRGVVEIVPPMLKYVSPNVSPDINGGASIEFSGTPGCVYIIEASTNMVNWQTIGVATHVDADKFKFEDPDFAKFLSRYYRVVAP